MKPRTSPDARPQRPAACSRRAATVATSDDRRATRGDEIRPYGNNRKLSEFVDYVDHAPHPRGANPYFLAGIRARENAASPSRAFDITRSGQMPACQVMTRTH